MASMRHHHLFAFTSLVLFGLLGLLTLVVVWRQTNAWEMPLVLAAARLRNPALTALIAPITFITSAIPTGVLCLSLSARRIHRRRPHGLRELACATWPMLALVLAAVINIGMRVAIGRLRPSVTLIESNFMEIQAAYQRFAFPSGHATTGILGFGTLALLVWPRAKWRWLVLIFALLVIAGTGFGRVYLGVHWPTDVMGGYLLGAACMCGVVAFTCKLR